MVVGEEDSSWVVEVVVMFQVDAWVMVALVCHSSTQLLYLLLLVEVESIVVVVLDRRSPDVPGSRPVIGEVARFGKVVVVHHNYSDAVVAAVAVAGRVAMDHHEGGDDTTMKIQVVAAHDAPYFPVVEV